MRSRVKKIEELLALVDGIEAEIARIKLGLKWEIELIDMELKAKKIRKKYKKIKEL